MDLASGLMKENMKLKNDISLAKQGDKPAFERLINMYRLSLYRVARGILKNEDDLEDAFQETILKAYKGIIHLKKNEYFKTWLMRIMINECNGILKKRKKMIYMEDVSPEELTMVDKTDRMELIDAINCLETDLKIVTLLYYYEDMLQKDIAETLNVPEGTVRSRLSRAREKLRQLLVIE